MNAILKSILTTTMEGVIGIMKEYECVEVNHHNKIAEVTEKYIADGWRLYSYQAINMSMTKNVNHYLMFEKG